jgi:hypothetical protein
MAEKYSFQQEANGWAIGPTGYAATLSDAKELGFPVKSKPQNAGYQSFNHAPVLTSAVRHSA